MDDYYERILFIEGFSGGGSCDLIYKLKWNKKGKKMKYILFVFIFLLIPSFIQAACLKLEVIDRVKYWVNQCNVFINYTYYDEGGCKPRNKNKFPCAWQVGAYKKHTSIAKGRVSWYECRSPGGLSDNYPIEISYGRIVCSKNYNARQRQTRENAKRMEEADRLRQQKIREYERRVSEYERQLRLEEEEYEMEMDRYRRQQRRLQDLHDSARDQTMDSLKKLTDTLFGN